MSQVRGGGNEWKMATAKPAAKPVAAAARKASWAMACRRCRRQLVCIRTSHRPAATRPLVRDRLGQRLDELLELPGRPALERLAPRLVGGDDRVAVVPVQPRLGVQPERAPRLLGDG